MINSALTQSPTVPTVPTASAQPLQQGIIGYHFATTPNLPRIAATGFEYWVAANGVFARAARPGIEVLLPVDYLAGIKGLAPLKPYLLVEPLVPGELLIEMWARACTTLTPTNDLAEVLFHLTIQGDEWQLHQPGQEQTTATVTPLDISATSSTWAAAIEVHSHANYSACFSSTDDADESMGFRVYGVLGRVRSLKPEMVFRVGVFGHFWEVPAHRVFSLDQETCFFKDQCRAATRSNCNFYSHTPQPASTINLEVC